MTTMGGYKGVNSATDNSNDMGKLNEPKANVCVSVYVCEPHKRQPVHKRIPKHVLWLAYTKTSGEGGTARTI